MRRLILLALLAAAPALSQSSAPASSALRNHDTRAPIDIDAARVEVRDREKQALFSGDVKIKQGAMNLDAASVRVFYEGGASGDPTILRVDAEGGVRLQSPSERATASFGVYDVSTRQLTMLGDVTLNQGNSVLRGERLVIDLESGRSTLDGASSKDGRPATRVTGRFVVPERPGG